MRNLSLYIVLILIFLGLSKSFNISSKGTKYIYNETAYNGFFLGDPLSVILTERFETGFLIKTYYHRYLIVEGVNPPKFITVRTSQKHYQKYAKFVGLSIFRRTERGLSESKIPLPPGSLYVGNSTYGSWRRNRKSGEKQWEFHRAYKNFPLHFAWGDYRPSYPFYEKLQESVKFEQPFFGLNQEFGSSGEVSLKYFNQKQNNTDHKSENLKALFNKLLSAPPWNSKKSLPEIIKQQGLKTRIKPL